jgi:uncharacterized protein YndB with AHSA1/START domain
MDTNVKMEYSYNASSEKIWKAITVKEEMKLWYFDLEEFKPEVGFEFRFWGGTEERQYLHICIITEVVVGRKLCHTWSYDGIPGLTNLTFEIISEEDGNSKLKLSHTGFETFPADNPDLKVANFIEGWTHILGTSLKNYLKPQT